MKKTLNHRLMNLLHHAYLKIGNKILLMPNIKNLSLDLKI